MSVMPVNFVGSHGANFRSRGGASAHSNRLSRLCFILLVTDSKVSSSSISTSKALERLAVLMMSLGKCRRRSTVIRVRVTGSAVANSSWLNRNVDF